MKVRNIEYARKAGSFISLVLKITKINLFESYLSVIKTKVTKINLFESYLSVIITKERNQDQNTCKNMFSAVIYAKLFLFSYQHHVAHSPEIKSLSSRESEFIIQKICYMNDHITVKLSSNQETMIQKSLTLLGAPSTIRNCINYLGCAVA